MIVGLGNAVGVFVRLCRSVFCSFPCSFRAFPLSGGGGGEGGGGGRGQHRDTSGADICVPFRFELSAFDASSFCTPGVKTLASTREAMPLFLAADGNAPGDGSNAHACGDPPRLRLLTRLRNLCTQIRAAISARKEFDHSQTTAALGLLEAAMDQEWTRLYFRVEDLKMGSMD